MYPERKVLSCNKIHQAPKGPRSKGYRSPEMCHTFNGALIGDWTGSTEPHDLHDTVIALCSVWSHGAYFA